MNISVNKISLLKRFLENTLLLLRSLIFITFYFNRALVDNNTLEYR